MRIIVTGGRNYTDKEKVYGALDVELAEHGENLVIIQGGAAGTDQIARRWCYDNRVTLITEFANWKLYGEKRAGAIRNLRMIVQHKPSKVISFPGNKGTRDMLRAAFECNLLIERKD